MITNPVLTRNEQQILGAILSAADDSDQAQVGMSDLATATGLHVGEVIAGMVRLREYRIVRPETWTAPRQAAVYAIDRDRVPQELLQ